MRYNYMFTVMFLSFLFSKTFSQITPYIPIEFVDYQPKWIHVPIDSTIIDGVKYSGMNHFLSVDDFPLPMYNEGDYLYISVATANKENRIIGGFVEKINLKTGKTVWSNFFDYRNNDRDEHVEAIYVNEDDNLEVVTDRRIKNTNWISFSFGDTSIISKWIFDKNTGFIKNHLYEDPSNSLLKQIRFSTSNRTILYPKANGEFQYVVFDDYYYSQYILDDKGYLIDTMKASIVFDETFSYDSVYLPYKFRMLKINEDTLLTLDFLYDRNNRQDFNRQTKITRYNKDLNVKKSIKVDSFLPDRFDLLRLFSSSNSYISIMGRYKYHYIEKDTFFYRFFDYEGNLIRHFSTIYNNENVRLSYTYLGKEKDFLIVAVDNDLTKLIFLKPKEDGGFTFIKEIYFKDNSRVFIPQMVMQLKNGDVLIKGINSNKTKDFTQLQQWRNWICIDGKDLGLETTTSDIKEVVKKHLNLYPNPTKDKLQIEFAEIFTGKLEVIDELGRVVLSKDITDSKVVSIDVSSLDSGSYFVKANNGKDKYKVKAFVKE